jgi:cobalt-precorrin-7 (C5)-methyltransferase
LRCTGTGAVIASNKLTPGIARGFLIKHFLKPIQILKTIAVHGVAEDYMSTSNKKISMTIVGVGPGDPDMLTLKGQHIIAQADLVVGFKTVLNVVEKWVSTGELCPMSYRDQEEVLDYAQAEVAKGRSCVVCAWGDLNVSAKELIDRVRRRATDVTLVPGISSIQFACARSGIYMEESLFITLHKRADTGSDLEELLNHLNDGLRNIILLPRPFDLMPSLISQNLIEAGIPPEQPLLVHQRLSLEGEKSWDGTLQGCADSSEEYSDLSIMVFKKPY